MEDLLTVDEAARALRVTRGTMYRKIQTGQVRAVRLGTGEKAPIRIEESELERYVKASTVGRDFHTRAEKILTLQGIDPAEATAEEYTEALRDAGDYSAELAVDRLAHQIHEDVEAAHQAAGHRAVGTHWKVGSDTVDVEKVINEELARLPFPWPVGVQLLGVRGVGREALRILHDQGLTEYDEAAYRKAVRQAIKEAINPKRELQ